MNLDGLDYDLIKYRPEEIFLIISKLAKNNQIVPNSQRRSSF